MNPTKLKDIKAYRITLRITVRVSRIWRPKKFNSDKYDGMHHVLVDETGQGIHAIIDEADYPYVTEMMEQGQIYDIFKFNVRPDPSRFKVVDHEVLLYFNERTKFVKIEQPGCPIPQHYFNLIDFSFLRAEEQKQNDSKKTPTVLADIYGCIKSIVPEHQIFVKTKSRMESKCDIIIENTRREDLRITLWGDIAKSFDIRATQDLLPPVLAILTSLRLSKYQDVVTASSSNHTSVILNPCLPQTDEYMIEFNKHGDRVKILSTPFKRLENVDVKQQEKKTISELNALNPENFMNKTVFCTATLRRFPTHNGWWYRACPVSGCYKQVTEDKESNKYVCAYHEIQDPLPSYRMQVTIDDGDSQATLTLFGKEAERFFDNTCSELLNKRSYPNEETLPEEIEKTVGKTYTFEVKVNFNGELVVRAIYSDPDFEESNKKRTGESIQRALFISDPKKARRETSPATSSKHEKLKQKED